MQTQNMIKHFEDLGLTCKYSEPSGTYTFYADFKTQKPKAVFSINDNTSYANIHNPKLTDKYMDWPVFNEWKNTPKEQRGSANEYEVAGNMSPLEHATTLVNRELVGIDLPYAYKITINIVDTKEDTVVKPTHPIVTEAKHMPIYLGGKDLNERFICIMDQYVKVDDYLDLYLDLEVKTMLKHRLTHVLDVIKAMYDNKRAYVEVEEVDSNG